MTGPGWAAAAITAMTLAWAVTTWVLARALRAEAARATQAERLSQLAERLSALATSTAAGNAALAEATRLGLDGLDRRLRWLETHLWSRQRRDG